MAVARSRVFFVGRPQKRLLGRARVAPLVHRHGQIYLDLIDERAKALDRLVPPDATQLVADIGSELQPMPIRVDNRMIQTGPHARRAQVSITAHGSLLCRSRQSFS